MAPTCFCSFKSFARKISNPKLLVNQVKLIQGRLAPSGGQFTKYSYLKFDLIYASFDYTCIQYQLKNNLSLYWNNFSDTKFI